MSRRIFPLKLYFSTVGVNKRYGYISRDLYGNVKIQDVSASEYAMEILAAFARIELDTISAKLIFTLDKDSQSIPFVKTEESLAQFLERIFRYTELVNKTVVSVYNGENLVGSMFPPSNVRECFYSFFKHNNYALDVKERRIDIAIETDYESISPKISCNIGLNTQDEVVTAVLKIDETPILYLPYNSDSFALNDISRKYECIGNVILTYYTCAYAHSFMHDDEMLLVNNDLDHYTLCGISITNNKIREIKQVSPVVAASYVMRQPFMSISSGEFKTFIPVQLDGLSMWEYLGKRRFFHTDYYCLVRDMVFDTVEGLYANDGESHFEDYRKVFVQPFGYNKHINFCDSVFANDLLSWF